MVTIWGFVVENWVGGFARVVFGWIFRAVSLSLGSSPVPLW